MARKKIWSYAFKDNHDYVINNELKKEKLFFIWEALNLRRKNPSEFSSLTFMSTQSSKDKRAELIPVKSSKTAFFRYKSETTTHRENLDSDSDLLSHETAILVLSEMNVIKFQEGSTVYEIEFDNIKKDELKIRFENGAIYYPDLMGFFKKPEQLFKKWGGKVAIEVRVTHKCGDAKIKDFQDHNIPIIEVTLTDKMRLKSELNNTDLNENDMEKYYNFLRERFSKAVYMRVISNPTMPNEYSSLLIGKNKKISELESKIADLIAESEKSLIERNSQHSIINSLEEKFSKNIEAIRSHKNEVCELSNLLVSEKNRSAELIEKIKYLDSLNYKKMSLLQRIRRVFSERTPS